jgi:hypothetical protein
MIRRQSHQRLKNLLREAPVVAILGPRQCGKTTFARDALRDWRYVDLERPSDAAPFLADPETRLEQLGDHVILDEAQRQPGLFPVLRGIIDRQRRTRGRFVILGSASPALVQSISESLAGRVAFLDLTPFVWSEVRRHRGGLARLWSRGGFPDAFLAARDSAWVTWMEGYTRSIIERDLPSLGIDISPVLMRRLWTMLAHGHGGFWNASRLAASLGVSYHTVNRYTDILEQLFLVRKLAPYHANLGKRLVKSPKVYLRDSGLLHYLVGIHRGEDLNAHPVRGASWEGFALEQVLALVSLVAPAARPWCWRTSDGHEIDLLIEIAGSLTAVEFKVHRAPGPDEARGIRAGMAHLGLERGFVVFPGTESYSLGRGVTALPANQLLADLSAVRRMLGHA